MQYYITAAANYCILLMKAPITYTSPHPEVSAVRAALAVNCLNEAPYLACGARGCSTFLPCEYWGANAASIPRAEQPVQCECFFQEMLIRSRNDLSCGANLQ